MLKGEYEKQAGLEESVLVLAKSYFEYITLYSLHSRTKEVLSNGTQSKRVLSEIKKRLDELNIFTDNGESIELRHEWADLSQEEANLVVGTLSKSFTDLVDHFGNVRGIPQPLVLSGDGELPNPEKEPEPNPNLTLRR